MTRRMFFGGIAGVCLRQEGLVLEAIAAERMPHRMVVRGVTAAPFYELRDYGIAAQRVVGVLDRHGVRVVLEENGRCLFAFESLASREQTWREVGADPEWIGIREGALVREIAVYRTVSRNGSQRTPCYKASS